MDDVIEVTGQLVITPRARDWCKLPYPGHPNGCPNNGQRPCCPPTAPMVDAFIDLEQPHWFVIERFNLKDHKERMLFTHTDWSDRQAKCVLYWQGTVKKRLREKTETFIQTHPGAVYTLLPEAMGVNVIVTARRLGIPIEIKPENFVHKISLVGYPPE